jgi:hypothetical protein
VYAIYQTKYNIIGMLPRSQRTTNRGHMTDVRPASIRKRVFIRLSDYQQIRVHVRTITQNEDAAGKIGNLDKMGERI